MASPLDPSSLRELPIFDEAIYAEATPLYGELSIERYCLYATRLLNSPSIRNHIETSAGIRAVCNSFPVFASSQDGLMSISLFYLVALCEGILMPHLQPLVSLAEEKGYRGPRNASGRFLDLERAKKDFGPAISFLAGPAAPLFVSAPILAKRIAAYEQEQLSRLRNCIAHLNFRLEVVRTDLRDSSGFPSDPILAKATEAGFKVISEIIGIHNPHERKIVDVEKSLVRYEGALAKPVTKSSAARTLKDMREYVDSLEKFAFTLALAYLDACRVFGKRLFSGTCTHCHEGFVAVPATEPQATCPACGIVSETILVESGT